MIQKVFASTSLLAVLSLIPTLLSAQHSSVPPKVSIADPMELVQKDSVEFSEISRSFREEKFEGLRKRYRTIEGVVMVGVTNSNGEVLLEGPQKWAPPGGSVQPGEDWAAAARRIIEQQTGKAITIDEPVLVERMIIKSDNSKGAELNAIVLHIRASFSDPPNSVTDSIDFKWFSEVPVNAHPNHVQHIGLYLHQD